MRRHTYSEAELSLMAGFLAKLIACHARLKLLESELKARHE